jgi:hypothetical protein
MFAICNAGVSPVSASILSTAIPVPIAASRNPALPIVRENPDDALFSCAYLRSFVTRLGDCLLAGFGLPPALLGDRAAVRLAGVARVDSLFIPRFPYQKRLPATRLDFAGNQRTCYVKLLCNRSLVLVLLGNRMGGDSNPRCLSAHTLSRRAQ